MSGRLKSLIEILKGGAGSGNWGHVGRQGKRGGSAPTKGWGAAMSLNRGRTAAERQSQARTGKQPFKIPVNEATKQYVLDRLSTIYEPEDIDRALKDLNMYLEDAPLSIRVDSDILFDHILNGEQRFKNQHETHTSGGALDPEWRKRAEVNAIGEENWSPSTAPIYGYMDTEANGMYPSASWYGNAQVILKDEVRDRTTITANDSLFIFDSKSAVGTPLNNPGPEGLDDRILHNQGGYNQGEYIEAQIFGGVTVNDIASVRFDRWTADNTPGLTTRLDELGIPYEFTP